MASFADRLTALRDRAGLSKYALAQRSGITKQALSLLEQGEREPTWETVQRLALALGVDCRAFVDPGLALPPEQPPARRGRPPKAGPAPATPATEQQAVPPAGDGAEQLPPAQHKPRPRKARGPRG